MMRLKELLENIEGTALDRLEKLIMSGSSHDADDDHRELLKHLHQMSNAGMHIRLLAKIVTKQAPLYAQLFSRACEENTFKTDHPLECAESYSQASSF